jgi:hypothetical protein
MPVVRYEARHTNPLPPTAVVHLSKALVFAVYFRVMIVSITLTNNVLDVLDVVVDGGGSSALPPVGMLPAKIGVDSVHMSTSAIANRFIDVAPLRVLRKMPKFLHKPERRVIGTTRQEILQGGLERITIRLHSLNFSLIESLKTHADDLSEAGYRPPYREPGSSP